MSEYLRLLDPVSVADYTPFNPGSSSPSRSLTQAKLLNKARPQPFLPLKKLLENAKKQYKKSAAIVVGLVIGFGNLVI